MKNDTVLLGHGSGGRMAADLIKEVFIGRFGNPDAFPPDAAIVETDDALIAFTTDSYVVDPIFFPGGNIGKLAVCGTVNDLAVSGAIPIALSSAFIIEEGFPVTQLEEIVTTMAQEAQSAGIRIVTGDTKVVPKGKCDKIFINTAGIGQLPVSRRNISTARSCAVGDKIIINGFVGDHGVAIMSSRNQIEFNPKVLTDCASLNNLIESVFKVSKGVKFMRDATRGGLATVLCELAAGRTYGIEINESSIPVHPQVEGFCEMFGFDPLYMANEGKVVMVVAAEDCEKIIEVMHTHPLGINSKVIGQISESFPSKVVMHTNVGGKRMIDMLAGEQLPRIC